MRLNKLVTKKDIAKLKPLYERAFPASEKKPFSLIVSKVARGKLEALEILDDNGAYVGFFIVILGDALLLDYFAVSEACRGKGIGTEALKLLSEHTGFKRIIIEIEDPLAPADNTAERKKRLNFYLRNGFILDGKINLFGVDMLRLSINGQVGFKEYKAVFEGAFGKILSMGLKERM